MAQTLGKTLVIANPAAQNGYGAAAARFVEERLRGSFPGDGLAIRMTEARRHGLEIAAGSQGFDTVVALGGDGVIHEVANGLMAIPADKRPAFGILPVGSGNDYARTLDMDFAIERSVEQLLNAQQQPFDLGCCNGEYFVETLSFGLDAAIALDTMQRRVRTGKTGTVLFLESGIDMLLHNRLTYDYVLRYGEAPGDGAGTEPESAAGAEGGPEARDGAGRGAEAKGQMLMFAVQVGPTYGGGFRICPEASTDDGLLDLCIAHPPLGVLKALVVFLLTKNAHHTRFKQIEFMRAPAVTLRFEGNIPPVQIDGEPFEAEEFAIRCVPGALRVLVPK